MHCRYTQRYSSHRLQIYTANTQRFKKKTNIPITQRLQLYTGSTNISHALQVYTKIPITQVADIHCKHTEIADSRSDSSKLKS